MEQIERVAITEDQLLVSNKYNRWIERGSQAWIDYNNGRGMIDDDSNRWYNKAEKLLQQYVGKKSQFSKHTLIAVNLDKGVGLYPTIELRFDNGKCFTEHRVADFFKQINGFWN